MFLSLPVLAIIQSDLGYMSIWLFDLVVEMGTFSSISSVNFAQFCSFYISDWAEPERAGKKIAHRK